ncbi:MAG: hypothetical protein PQJ59_07300 [Spirochaetales bacterium]|nr:hypothetical protein [Spirochaetales bacterium]
MQKNNTELKDIEEKIEQLEVQINSHCIAWAQDDLSSRPEEDLPAEISSVQDRITELEDKKISIEELLKKRESLNDQKKTIKSSETEELKSRSDIYQVLGRRAFELYKKGSLNDSEGLDNIFSPLLEWEDRIRHADNELYRIRSREEEGTFIHRMGALIKRSTQSTRKKAAGDSLNKYYGKAGEQLIKEGYFTEIAENGLSDIYDEFQNKEKYSRQLREEEAELDRSLEKLDDELDELCDGVRPQRAIKGIEDARDAADLELDEAYLSLGKVLYDEKKKGGATFGKVIDELKGEYEILNREKARCLIEKRLSELKESFEKKVKERDQQKVRVDREQAKWENLRDETEEISRSLVQLESERTAFEKKDNS